MSLHTPIEWCDSTVNPVMGCDGCELWDPERGIFICYAGVLGTMRAGNPGYADAFLDPKMFPGRMAAAARWRDLRGTARPDKTWLDGLPRVVFISDMGDALSASVPFEYLRDELVRVVAGWAHIGMWLTKQPQRMAALAAWLAEQGIPWPRNLWAGTSITGPGQGARVRHIKRVGAARTFLSIEPALRDPGELDLTGVDLAILGNESGAHASVGDVGPLRSMRDRAWAAGSKVLVKQIGTNPIDAGAPVKIRDRKGGDPAEWPADLRVREFPKVEG